MPKKPADKTAYEVRRLTRPGLYAVGGVTGLYLQVRSAQSRSWILRILIGIRRHSIGLGSFPSVTLELAREEARKLRQQVSNGINPLAERAAAQDKLRAEQVAHMDFKHAAQACWRAKSQEFRNKKHAAQWINTLTTYAFPLLGTMDVRTVETAHVMKVLEPIWLTHTETATRLRGRIEAVFEYAKHLGLRKGKENPAVWSSLKHLLPAPGKAGQQKENHPALPWERMPEFFPKLQQKRGVCARALEFAILTTARSQEVRLMLWDEVDLAKREWRVPPEHMKARLVHRVPLSDAALALLKSLPRMHGCPYVFPASRSRKPLTDAALSKTIKDMHMDSIQLGGIGWMDPKLNRIATAHGTARSSFKDWARNQRAEHPDWEDELSELQIAHVNSDKTRAAYARDELFGPRTPMMQTWGAYCVSQCEQPVQRPSQPSGRARRNRGAKNTTIDNSILV